jgi:hypothetical protein
MRTLRNLSGCLLICLLSLNSHAGSKLPVDASGEVVYSQSFKLQSNFTDEDAYALIQDWFNAGAGKFTCQNEAGPNCGGKNKTLVEEAFNNAQPLQSLDPASGRMSGKGLIKYFGSSSSSIGALYMEYYIVVEVSGHQLTATISKMKYHHFNQRTYAAKPIYGWQGGKPLDSADKLGSLVSNADENRDLLEVTAFVNKNIAALFSNLQSFLQSKTMVDTKSLPSALVKED